MSKVKEAIEKEKTKEGLPKEAFAIIGDPQDPETWKLPHQGYLPLPSGQN
jgi:hypothetical protein